MCRGAQGENEQMKKEQSMTISRGHFSFIGDLVSLVKSFVLVVNVLPVLSGYWLALYFTEGSFSDDWLRFVFTMLGSTFTVAGALILNNWYDVDIDQVMQRTKKRPTVTGRFSLSFVLRLGIIFSIIGHLLLAFTTIEALLYGFIGWFTYVFPYTMWTKRKYTLNTVIGSISGAVTPMIGWTAIASGFHLIPIVLVLILFIWQMPHTFVIAMRKYDEYRAANVAMLPVKYGFNMTKRQINVYVATLLPFPFLLSDLGLFFVICMTILNVVWICMSVYGFFTKDDQKWAQIQFLYSVNYIAILFLLAMLVTL